MIAPNPRGQDVGPVVEQVGKRPRPICSALPALRRALDELEAGRVVAAGIHTREAARRVMVTLCELHRCLPRREKTRRFPVALRMRLRRSGCSVATLDDLDHALGVGNRVAHCHEVLPVEVEDAIRLVYEIAYSLGGLATLPLHDGARTKPAEPERRKPYTPTAEQIRAECERIRASWGYKDMCRRGFLEDVRARPVYRDPDFHDLSRELAGDVC